ncbi:MAG: glycosyltransferase family 39 protein [Candidatus Wallbacteria bacterium]|nr:glycosyltransferase family 39 protein [Candidatus Wallbacteria bacterium]
MRFPDRRLVLTLLAIGVFLRFFGLALESFWYDELISMAGVAPDTLASTMSSWVTADRHPPLHPVVLWLAVHLLGSSEAAARLPSALASCLALAALHAGSRRVLGSAVAFSATAYMAFTHASLWSAQEARPYAFLLLFSTICTCLWLQLLEDWTPGVGPSRSRLWAYCVASVGCCYSHYFALPLVGVQLAYLLLVAVRTRHAILSASTLSLMIVAAFMPWLPYMAAIFVQDSSSYWMQAPGLGDLVKYANFFLFDYQVASGLAFAALVLLPVGLNAKAVCERLAEVAGSPRGLRSPVPALILLVLAIFLPLFAFAQFKHVMSAKNLIILAPALYLLMAVGLEWTRSPAKSEAIWACEILAGLFFAVLAAAIVTGCARELLQAHGTLSWHAKLVRAALLLAFTPVFLGAGRRSAALLVPCLSPAFRTMLGLGAYGPHFAFGVLALCFSLSAPDRYGIVKKEQWREAAACAACLYEPGDLICGLEHFEFFSDAELAEVYLARFGVPGRSHTVRRGPEGIRRAIREALALGCRRLLFLTTVEDNWNSWEQANFKLEWAEIHRSTRVAAVHSFDRTELAVLELVNTGWP